MRQVQSSFNEDGETEDPAYEKSAERFIDELLWYTEALSARRALDSE